MTTKLIQTFNTMLYKSQRKELKYFRKMIEWKHFKFLRISCHNALYFTNSYGLGIIRHPLNVSWTEMIAFLG